MRQLNSNPKVDNSDLVNYPHGRIRDNDGSGNGTDVNERVYGDVHSMKEKLMILAGIVANNLPDNEINGYQLIDALIALASKNDYIQDLTTAGGVLQIPVKIALMKLGESLICFAASDLTTETTIKGSDNSVTAVTFSGNFKANEYIRFIKTSSGVTLVRIGDNASLNAMVNELLFLKKASQAQENAGAIDTVATTPLVNKIAYTLRTIGTDSVNYLATAFRNGLYPKEHYAIVAGIGASNVKNVGWFSGLDISVGGVINYPVSGNIIAAQSFVLSGQTDEQFIMITMQNAMTNLNYYVRSFNESQGDIRADNDINGVVFKPMSTTQFQLSMKESTPGTQNLRIHLEVVQY